MKIIISTILVLTSLVTFAMGNRSTLSLYERVSGLTPVGKPIYGVEIFNSQAEFDAFHRARTAANKDSKPFDFDNFSLLTAYLGKDGGDSCIEVYRIDETEKLIVVYTEPVKCTEEWNAPYVYYKIKKTAKLAKIIVK